MLSVVNLYMFSFDTWANVVNNQVMYVSFDKLVLCCHQSINVCFPLTTGLMLSVVNLCIFFLTTGLVLSVVNLCMFSFDNWSNVVSS